MCLYVCISLDTDRAVFEQGGSVCKALQRPLGTASQMYKDTLTYTYMPYLCLHYKRALPAFAIVCCTYWNEERERERAASKAPGNLEMQALMFGF